MHYPFNFTEVTTCQVYDKYVQYPWNVEFKTSLYLPSLQAQILPWNIT